MNARKNARPKLHADAAYENAHLVARDLVDRIRELLQEMPTPDGEDGVVTWTHVGDITEINSRLMAVVSFLENEVQAE